MGYSPRSCKESDTAETKTRVKFYVNHKFLITLTIPTSVPLCILPIVQPLEQSLLQPLNLYFKVLPESHIFHNAFSSFLDLNHKAIKSKNVFSGV